jgi:hypothetical protein
MDPLYAFGVLELELVSYLKLWIMSSFAAELCKVQKLMNIPRRSSVEEFRVCPFCRGAGGGAAIAVSCCLRR